MAFTGGYKVNEGTQYEFTVSNETIAEAVQADGGITESDIANYCYTALIDSRIKSVFIQSTKNVMATGFDGWQAENMPYYFIRDTRYVDSNVDINKDDVVYERNFITWNGTIYPGTPQEKQGTFLVMDMKDIKRWYVDFNSGMFITDTFASEITESGVTTTFPGYNGAGYTYLSYTNNEPIIHSDNNDPLLNPNEDLHIVNVLVINDELWIGQLNPSCHGEGNTGIMQSTYAQYIDSYVQGYLKTSSAPPPIIYQRGSDAWAGIAEIKEMNYPDLGSRTTVYRSYVESSNGVIMEINGNSGGTFDVRTESGAHCKDLDTLLTWQSWCGLKFNFDNVMYKPIIQNGVIVGYSDDMSAPSEYDQMTNVTGNNITPIPPGPAPDPWDSEKTPGTDAYGVGFGLVDIFVMSGNELEYLVERLNSNQVPAGMDVANAIMGCKRFPFSLAGFASSGIANVEWTYKMGETGSVQRVLWPLPGTDNPIPAHRVYRTFKELYLGQMRLSKFWQNIPFLNHEITATIYIPFCGTFPIDIDAIIDKTLDIYLCVDLISGGCTARVMSNGSMIINGAGNCAAEIPMSIQNYGLLKAELRQNTSQMIYNVASATGGIAAAVASGGVLAPIVTSMVTQQGFNLFGKTISRSIIKNNIPTTAIGSSGNSSEWCLPMTAFIEFSLPKPKIDAGYAHSNSYLKYEKAKLSNCSGLTMCVNPDVSTITEATDEERASIYTYLQNGVYL